MPSSVFPITMADGQTGLLNVQTPLLIAQTGLLQAELLKSRGLLLPNGLTNGEYTLLINPNAILLRNSIERGHVDEKLLKMAAATAGQQQQLVSAASAHQQAPQLPAGRYKTELCRPFEEHGYCKYGDKCQFAHGGNELRSMQRHPKYKTDKCRTYHSQGYCPYGHRCHFIHDEDEPTLVQLRARQLAKQQQQQQQQQLASALPPAGPVAQLTVPQVLTTPLLANTRPGFASPLSAVGSAGSAVDSPRSSVTSSPTLSPRVYDESVSSSAASGSPGYSPSNSPFDFCHQVADRNLPMHMPTAESSLELEPLASALAQLSCRSAPARAGPATKRSQSTSAAPCQTTSPSKLSPTSPAPNVFDQSRLPVFAQMSQ